MSKPVNWACWAWKESGVVKYVGVGPFDGCHPAIRRWRDRFEDESPLNLWLQGFIDEPDRVLCGSPIMPRETARALAAIYRARNAETILTAREHSGGGRSRSVVIADPEDGSNTWVRTFASVREAAKHAGINPSTVTRRCKSAKWENWAFLEDDFG